MFMILLIPAYFFPQKTTWALFKVAQVIHTVATLAMHKRRILFALAVLSLVLSLSDYSLLISALRGHRRKINYFVSTDVGYFVAGALSGFAGMIACKLAGQSRGLGTSAYVSCVLAFIYWEAIVRNDTYHYSSVVPGVFYGIALAAIVAYIIGKLTIKNTILLTIYLAYIWLYIDDCARLHIKVYIVPFIGYTGYIALFGLLYLPLLSFTRFPLFFVDRPLANSMQSLNGNIGGLKVTVEDIKKAQSKFSHHMTSLL